MVALDHRRPAAKTLVNKTGFFNYHVISHLNIAGLHHI